MKYHEYIMINVRQRLGVGQSDKSMDARIEAMDPEDVWDHYLSWEGFFGWGGRLHRVHELIFKPEES